MLHFRLDERELHRRVLRKKKEEEKLRHDGKLEQMADLIIPLTKVSSLCNNIQNTEKILINFVIVFIWSVDLNTT